MNKLDLLVVASDDIGECIRCGLKSQALAILDQFSRRAILLDADWTRDQVAFLKMVIERSFHEAKN